MRALFLLFSLAFSLLADQFSYQIYDDYFAGTDQHFTYGACISWLDNEYKEKNVSAYSSLMVNSLANIKSHDNAKNYTSGISLSQTLYTPVDILLSTPQYNDIPYAGYLALSFYIFEWDEKTIQEYRLDTGVVGSASLSGPLQYNFHVLIKDPRLPLGWSTQLGPHPMLNLLYRYGEKSWEKKNGILNADWFNQIGMQLGDYTTDIFISSAFRFGKNYSNSFNVHYPYLREESSLLQTYKQNGFGWDFSIGGNAELVGYSYVLNEAKNKGYNTSPYFINNSIYSGIDLLYNKHLFSIFYQAQSPVAPAQRGFDFYGGFTYAYRF
jgi:lipid A 3-O-deacylase